MFSISPNIRINWWLKLEFLIFPTKKIILGPVIFFMASIAQAKKIWKKVIQSIS